MSLLVAVLTTLSVFLPRASLAKSPGAVDPAVASADEWYRPSDSPVLRLDEDKASWPSLTPPDPEAEPDPETATPDPTATVELDLATGEEKTISPGSGKTDRLHGYDLLNGRVAAPVAAPFPGQLPSLAALKTVIGIDDRVQITSTTIYPWRTLVKLFVTLPNGVQGICSGAMIDNFHVLTAGHCIHDVDSGGWATAVEVVPALSNSPDFPQGPTSSNFDSFYMPFYHAFGTFLRSYTGWVQNQSPDHDWAVVTLDRNLGASVGWMGRKTVNGLFGLPNYSYYVNIFNTAGYPGDLSAWPSPAMFFDSDNGCDSSTNRHWYFMDTAGGQSGSPVWEFNSSTNERFIVSIHAYGSQGNCSPNSNSGTRLNGDKFDRIQEWLDEDSPSPPVDLPILIDDGELFSGFSPQTAMQGQTVVSLFSDVRNIGTAASGTFTVRYYASANTTISSSDHLLCSVTVPSINPFDWRDADCSSAVANVPAGDYYVGWIIDGDGLVIQKESLEDTHLKPLSYGLLTVQSSLIFADGFESGDTSAW